MPPKTHTLRLSDEQWDALGQLADALDMPQRQGQPGRNALIRAIADGKITLSPQRPDLGLRLHLAEMQIEGLQDRLRGFVPTDLP